MSACLLMGSPAYSSDNIKVVGLFKNAAVVQMNGKRVMLKKGARKNNGMLLIHADAKSALIEYQGVEKRYYLRASIGTGYAKREYGEVAIAMDAHRRYYTAGSINGQVVGFLVDTGATSIAMNGEQASELGIDYRLVGKEGQVVTASGVVRSFSIRLNRVKVGDIELKEVDAVVISGRFPMTILLGMTFLEQVEMSESNGVLRLRKKY